MPLNRSFADYIDDDGYEVNHPVEVEAEVPEPEEVRGKEHFLTGFHRFEQAVLDARNEAGERLAEQYLEEIGTAGKKTKKQSDSMP